MLRLTKEVTWFKEAVAAKDGLRDGDSTFVDRCRPLRLRCSAGAGRLSLGCRWWGAMLEVVLDVLVVLDAALTQTPGWSLALNGSRHVPHQSCCKVCFHYGRAFPLRNTAALPAARRSPETRATARAPLTIMVSIRLDCKRARARTWTRLHSCRSEACTFRLLRCAGHSTTR